MKLYRSSPTFNINTLEPSQVDEMYFLYEVKDADYDFYTKAIGMETTYKNPKKQNLY